MSTENDYPELGFIDDDILATWRSRFGEDPDYWNIASILTVQTQRLLRELLKKKDTP